MTKARENSDYTGLQGDLALKSPVASPVFTGNVGIGGTPEAWHSSLTALQFGGNASLSSQTTQGASKQAYFSQNAYNDGDQKYISTDEASDYLQQNGSHNFRVAPSGSADAAISFTTAMTIANSGNVGIGTSSPAQLLEIKGGSNTSLRLHSNTETNSVPAIEMMRGTNATFGAGAYTNWRMQVTGGVFFIESGESGTTSERMLITTSGNTKFLDGAIGSGAWMKIGRHSIRSHANDDLFFYQANGLTTGSNLYAKGYYTFSDYRAKENIVPMTGATDRLKALNTYKFNFIDGMLSPSDSTVDGFLAHEVQAIVPEAVTGTKDAMMDEEYEVTPAVVDDEGVETTAAVMGTRSVPDMQGIDQSKLVPLLTATIQELIARIEALEA